MALSTVAVSLLAGAAATAVAADPELQVTHAPRGCVIEAHAVRIEARIEPPDDIRARVYFRGDSGDPRFYSVPMERRGALWVGLLPSPAPGTSRLAYYIAASAVGARGRAPASSAFIADVVTAPCPGGALPTSAEGPRELGVPAGAPRVPPGFETTGITAFIEEAGETLAGPSTAAAVTPLGALPIAPGARVRVVASPGERREEGKLVAVDGETLVLDTDGDHVRIPRRDLVSVEVKERGSGGMRVLGGLAGGVAGLAVTVLACASSDACDSVGVAWAGLGAGAAVGAALTGNGGWKPVTLATAGPVAVDLRVRRAAAGVELSVGF
jgi:hypothetical protein